MPKGIFYGDQRLANLVNFEVSLSDNFSISPYVIKQLLSCLKVANQLGSTSGLELPEAGGLLDPAKHLFSTLFGGYRLALALMACSAVNNK